MPASLVPGPSIAAFTSQYDQYLLRVRGSAPSTRASTRCPSLMSKRVSPHVIRHGTAMALLQAGVDIAVIAVWLGHDSIETTNVDVHANLAMKEAALAKIQTMDTPFRRFRPDDRLLAFLESL